MYPRNNASPEPIAIGAVIQISDGAVQTSGCTVRIRPIGVSEGAGAGTIAYTTDGVVMYTPTQTETNYTSFVLIASKAGCVPVAVTVVTTDASTPGRVRLDGVTHTSAVIPTVTAVTNAVTLPASASINITGNITGNLSGSVGSVTGAVGSVTGNVGGNVVGSVTGAVGSVTGNVGGNVVGSVGSVTGAVGSVTSPVTVGTINANAVNASALAADAVTEIQSGLATAASQTNIETKIDTIDGIVDAILVDTDSTIPTLLTAIDDFIDTEVNAIRLVTDKLDTMLVVDGAVWQMTTNSLENAPAGGGGAGDASQTTLLLVKAKTDLIVAGEVQFTAMVGSAGRISQPIMIGDDYLAANGRAFQWTIPARAGYVVGTSTCRFGGSNAELGTSWNVTGTVTDIGGGEWRLSFDMSKAVTGALLEGYYRWSVELISAGGTEITEVYSGRNVEVRAKQT